MTESPAERRERESFERYRAAQAEAVGELTLKYGVPVEAAVNIVYDAMQAAWNRGWDVAVRPMEPIKES